MDTAAVMRDSRAEILRAAQQELHRRGFHGASLDRILDRTGLTKGALYHYFPSKRALGYAVVDEVIAPYIESRWVAPLRDVPDPLPAITRLLEEAASQMSPEDVLHGCALNNLAQEMSPIDAGFRIRINRVFRCWRDGLSAALERGQSNGTVDPGIDADATATFLVAAIEGCVGMAKNAQDPALLKSCERSFRRFLDGLGTAQQTGAAERSERQHGR